MSVAISATIVITGLAVLDKEESITVLLVLRIRISGVKSIIRSGLEQ